MTALQELSRLSGGELARPVTYRLESCVRLIQHQSNGFQSKISLGSTVSAAKKAMNFADAINTPK